MPHRVFLHVGLPKSGTTYLQAVLGKNKHVLRERASVLYPGEAWSHQVDAVRDVCAMSTSAAQRARVDGSWRRLATEMAAWPGDSVVSMEWLCMANEGQIERIVRDVAPDEVHVVFTVRDMGRTVPAAWQEFSQNRSTWSWPDFLEQVTAQESMETDAGRLLWSQQDMPLLLARWSSRVPADRIHVVTVPQTNADPTELWRRMATVLGIEADGYDLTDLGSNASLGMESAELMRRVNERLRDRSLPVPRYNKVFKRYVAKQVLASRKGEESKVLLPTSLHPWARERAEQQIGAIEGSGARVVGDLDDLRPSFAPSAERQQEAATPDAEAVLDAAVHALVTVALEPPRRRKRGGKPGAAKRRRRPGPLRGAWYDVSRRVRGRSPRDLVAAAERRARGLLQRRR